MFNICRVQEEQTLKDEEADRVEGIRRHQHAEEVRQQIREKEKERVKATNAFFEEGIKLDQEAKARYVCFLKMMQGSPRFPRTRPFSCFGKNLSFGEN